jgi:hypothetical protein
MAVMEGCEVGRRRNHMEEERAIQHAGQTNKSFLIVSCI